MTVRLDGEVIRLEAACGVEEAETLTGFLQRDRRPVDISNCESLHGAVVQALLAFSAELRGESQDRFLRDLLAPALSRRPPVAS